MLFSYIRHATPVHTHTPHQTANSTVLCALATTAVRPSWRKDRTAAPPVRSACRSRLTRGTSLSKLQGFWRDSNPQPQPLTVTAQPLALYRRRPAPLPSPHRRATRIVHGAHFPALPSLGSLKLRQGEPLERCSALVVATPRYGTFMRRAVRRSRVWPKPRRCPA